MQQLLIALFEKLGAFGVWLSNPVTQLLMAPLLACILICLLPGRDGRLAKLWAVLGSGLSLLTALLMITGLPQVLLDASPMFEQYLPFQYGLEPQFQQNYRWLEIEMGELQSFGFSYSVGVDGLSLPLIVMSAAICLLAVIWALPRKERVRDFFALTMLLETSLLGVFVALDFVLFYVFWELMLIPMYFLIAGWGRDQQRAARAAMKFFIYTIFGSVFMLIAFIAMQVLSVGSAYTFSIIDLTFYYLTSGMAMPFAWRAMMFLGLLLGFAVKAPMFPFHTWLPDAHTEAPTEMSVILAAVLLKTGTYGYLRVLYPCFPDVAYRFGPLIAFCGLAAIVYGAAVTLMQTDMKRLVAYSSISHMGFIILGISAMNADATVGAVFQMVAHGVIIATLFFLSGAIERRYGTRDLRVIGGMLRGAPAYALTLAIAAFAGMGLPGLAGFWGEFLVLKGTFYNNPQWQTVQVGLLDGSRFMQIAAVVAVIGVLTSAVYMINLLQRVLPGEFRGATAAAGGSLTTLTSEQTWRGFRLTDGIVLIPLAAAIFLLGLFPRPVVDTCLQYAYLLYADFYLRF